MYICNKIIYLHSYLQNYRDIYLVYIAYNNSDIISDTYIKKFGLMWHSNGSKFYGQCILYILNFINLSAYYN